MAPLAVEMDSVEERQPLDRTLWLRKAVMADLVAHHLLALAETQLQTVAVEAAVPSLVGVETEVSMAEAVAVPIFLHQQLVEYLAEMAESSASTGIQVDHFYILLICCGLIQ